MFENATELGYRIAVRMGLLEVTHLMHVHRIDANVHGIPDGYHCEVLPQGDRIQVRMRRGDEVASSMWIVTGRVPSEENFSRSVHLGTTVELPNRVGYIFNASTDPQHRGRRLIAAMCSQALDSRTIDVDHLMASIDWTNQPSMRAFRRFGMQSVGSVWRSGIGHIQFSRVPKIQSPGGIEIGVDQPGWVLAL
ncbi:GNAT family N-acetyltransferase [Crateriforma conspicua]|uniref:N-acetyltransferase domain-containing protein n=1 Tax=Crateriforma conspicua TaxID=2527996 RepID=A0A5C6FJK8_9PLAN|nr:GNAT family N-acetyltransferase [Crateriforma conspicua]TWU62445.1 hypothetical protein V7x_41800 [Crateriforma conspicua]